jgi:sec-independent protein translocase protein TatA
MQLIIWRQNNKEKYKLFNLGMPELLVLLVLALIIFGPGKLPEVGKSLGRAMREFKEALRRSSEERMEGEEREEKCPPRT